MTPPDNSSTGGTWHLDKRVPVAIIVTLATQGILGVLYVAEIRKDVEILKAGQWAQRERDDRQDRASAEGLALVRNDIKELGQKLDRLIEAKRGKD